MNKSGDKMTIANKDRSRNQELRVIFTFSDGYNTMFYCEEGTPFVISNKEYEVVSEYWLGAHE